MSWYSFRPYVSVGQRRVNALRHVAKLQKKGHKAEPVRIEGRTIARTFWGKAWCDHLESYSDYANRLPRGRTYVRNGSVVDLQIKPGKITALVSGSDIYEITITIQSAPNPSWAAIKRACAGQISSLIDLLRGKLSEGVMRIITARDGGLLPKPNEIKLDCSCPDSAGLCKHLAAVFYGMGARLDERPELLFLLRQVDHLELLAQASDLGELTAAAANQKTIAAGEVADIFGIDFDPVASPDASAPMPGIPASPAAGYISRKRERAHAKKPRAPKTAAHQAPPPSKKAVRQEVGKGRLSVIRARRALSATSIKSNSATEPIRIKTLAPKARTIEAH